MKTALIMLLPYPASSWVSLPGQRHDPSARSPRPQLASTEPRAEASDQLVGLASTPPSSIDTVGGGFETLRVPRVGG